jgi:hypothetical protein
MAVWTSEDADRDIDLVLVSGAGASHEFGINGQKVPLMSAWSDSLVQKISSRSWAYLAATGLEKNLDGPTFEQRLGHFLRIATALEQIEQVLKPSLEFQAPPSGLTEDGLRTWRITTHHHVLEIAHLIRDSLYENFSPAQMDLDAAADAYRSLFEQLGITRIESMVYATTNYDVLGEYAVDQVGALPDTGETHGIANRVESRLSVDGLLRGMPRYVPIIHLHGRIGWYHRNDGQSYSSDIHMHNRDSGVPILMLPDPDKAYDTDPIITSLWSQFEEALGRAKRVFVLGHSLHDRPLLDALKRNVSPGERVAVGVRGDPEDPGAIIQDTGDMSVILAGDLPKAAIIPIHFAKGGFDIQASVNKWNERLKLSLEPF